MAETLYRGRDDEQILRGTREPHPGLLFERFPRLLSKRDKRYDMASGVRREWLETFIGQASGPNPRLARQHARLDAAIQGLGGQRRVFSTVGRLAIGLGNPNAADIGFSLDHATGMPVIPGSSVKGLALAGARLLDEQASARRLLGEGPTPGDPDAARSGTIAFLDALPDSGVGDIFEIDIITRHHDPEGFSRQKTPLDADDPNPVHFLVVKPEVRFVFRLLPLGGATKSDLADAWRWLAAALTDLGAGGKTAVGYGELVPDKKPDAASAPDDPLARARQIASQFQKGTAASLAPTLLALVDGQPGGADIVQQVVKKLGPGWLRQRVKKGKGWAQELLDASQAGGA